MSFFTQGRTLYLERPTTNSSPPFVQAFDGAQLLFAGVPSGVVAEACDTIVVAVIKAISITGAPTEAETVAALSMVATSIGSLPFRGVSILSSAIAALDVSSAPVRSESIAAAAASLVEVEAMSDEQVSILADAIRATSVATSPILEESTSGDAETLITISLGEICK